MILDLDLGQEVAKNRIGLISVTSVDHDINKIFQYPEQTTAVIIKYSFTLCNARKMS